jgi:hypothetical protein
MNTLTHAVIYRHLRNSLWLIALCRVMRQGTGGLPPL